MNGLFELLELIRSSRVFNSFNVIACTQGVLRCSAKAA